MDSSPSPLSSLPIGFHHHWDRFFDRAGPFTHDDKFIPGEPTKVALRTIIKVLVVGAGGLGCELLKNLALSGFSDIHVIDMDTIDLSNLNRQFLFRHKDIGQPKAVIAAQFINSRIPHCTVTPHFCRIEDKDRVFYEQFHLVILGLDSLQARRWINATIIGLCEPNDDGNFSGIPIIDGGTEGFAGNVRVIWPRISACFECAIEMFTQPKTFPICTIAHTPRLPEHCIAWAYILQWPNQFPDIKLDGDNPDHINWIMTTAKERGDKFGIHGITYAQVQGVVKNIIPAIASTNAIIAASCVTEAIKVITACQPPLNNYFMYNGTETVYTTSLELERNPACPVCGIGKLKLRLPRAALVQDLLDILSDRPDLQYKNPSLRTEDKTIYMQKPKSLEEATRPNLEKLLSEFVGDQGTSEIVVTDAQLPLSLTISIDFTPV